LSLVFHCHWIHFHCNLLIRPTKHQTN
jgi:hypothetical protein